MIPAVIPTVTEIEAMDRAALAAAWSLLFDRPVPKGMSRSYLRRFLAFEVQARRAGGLPKGFRKEVERLVADHAAGRQTRVPKPGGRLLREWNGVTHVVEISADGLYWNGTRYRSLSAIARAITGAKWSGPRFFGVRSADL